VNLIITGHSVSHYRQRKLGEACANFGVRTIVVGPQRWGDEQYKEYKTKDFIFKTLEAAGGPSFYTFNFKNLNRVISGFRPAVIYCMEEMFTLFARECIKLATEYRCPIVFFTWENKKDFRLSYPFDRIEQDAIESADKIICGNILAKNRMIKCGANKEKLHVLLQSGIDTELFKPDPNSKKVYDIIFHGRLVREKGLPFLENVCRNLQLSLLSVGGRGQYHFRYGDSMTWVNYESLPDIINRTRIGIQIPFSFQGYQEQGNFSAGECASCGLPVIISNNGSLAENYKDSPLIMIPENNEEKLKEELSILVADSEKQKKLGIEGREWILKNLSLEIMGKKLLKILELI
jgi:glycosyltransferase involved in cell wall biosynthesis